MSLPQELPGVQPAFPQRNAQMIQSELTGLSKREYIATALLSGLLASVRTVRAKRFAVLVAEAIEHTDELLKQLAEAPTTKGD